MSCIPNWVKQDGDKSGFETGAVSNGQHTTQAAIGVIGAGNGSALGASWSPVATTTWSNIIGDRQVLICKILTESGIFLVTETEEYLITETCM